MSPDLEALATFMTLAYALKWTGKMQYR